MQLLHPDKNGMILSVSFHLRKQNDPHFAGRSSQGFNFKAKAERSEDEKSGTLSLNKTATTFVSNDRIET